MAKRLRDEREERNNNRNKKKVMYSCHVCEIEGKKHDGP